MRTRAKSRPRSIPAATPAPSPTAPAASPTSRRYVERVNLAIDHVLTHLCDPADEGGWGGWGGGGLRLNDVARAAMMSPFHFHRVFQALMGETLADFVRRLRLEKALVLMAHSPRRKMSLTTIALSTGFSSSSDFSRAFKQRYNVPPSKFDLAAWRAAHAAELDAIVSAASPNHLSATANPDPASLRLRRLPPASNPDGFTVRIRDLPARTVAYIRVRNPYAGDAVFAALRRLHAWAERHSLAGGQWLGYQWDNPQITALKDCQYYVAVEVPSRPSRSLSRGSAMPPSDDARGRRGRAGAAEKPRGARTTDGGTDEGAGGGTGGSTGGGEIGRFHFPRMIVAQIELHGGIDLELRALHWLYGVWLPRSGYIPDDHPGFEAWIGPPLLNAPVADAAATPGANDFHLHIQLPIRRA